jgi:DNA-directed RNA polymerase subunit RPC12/RpoP
MYNLECRDCGATLRRAKRRFLDRFRYVESYRCPGCGTRYHITVVARLQMARFAKCPKCRYQDITPMKRIDKIDKMRGGVFNLIHRMFGGKLYHCWFCRLQFYDFRHTKARLEKDWLEGESGSRDMSRSRQSR